MEEPQWGVISRSVGHALRRAQVILGQHYARKLGRFGLSTIQIGILELVAVNEGVSQKRISELILSDPSVVVGAAAKLEALKLVSRERAVRDRRNYFLRITEEGRKVRKAALAAIQAAEADFLNSLSPRESDELLHVLHRIGCFAAPNRRGGGSAAKQVRRDDRAAR